MRSVRPIVSNNQVYERQAEAGAVRLKLSRSERLVNHAREPYVN